ncbi:MAG: insulinase family protein [Gammaproteobacteria bacterium]|nr:MAG: insulinase family protein [Gammaproteobacteria bacterium]
MKLIKILPLLFIAASCSSLSDKPDATSEIDNQTAITESSNGTHEKTFKNGMKVIVKEDHRAPVVISQVWYRVGSAQEHSGITGVSHVLEHMMFKGTEKYPSGTFSSTVAEIGARDNAFTGRDYTAYYQLMGKDNLETSFELESDRMLNLILSPEDFISELEVVKEERRLRTDDNPNALVYEQLYSTAFINSPYHHPIIGWMDDLHNLEIEDLADWYQRWYTPNNAALVVVGDVDPEHVFAMAEQYFGGLEGRTVKPSKPRLEHPQTGSRRVAVKAIAKLPYVMLGYKTPSLATAEEDWEPYALAVLGAVLDGGRSARFSKRLVRDKELVSAAGAGYNIFSRYPTLFLFDATPTEKHSIEEAEQALYDEIKEIQENLVSDKELKRVKAQVIASEVYQQDSIQRQATVIGSLETVGLGWQVMDGYNQRVNAITAEQVREVARKYLVEEGLTVSVLQPLEKQAPINEKQ